jgi:predicted nucleotide-binding protein
MMAARFKGTVEDMKGFVEKTGIRGQWQESSGKHSFRTQQDGILNWWPSSGTLQYQGTEPGKTQLEQAVTAAMSTGVGGTTLAGPGGRGASGPGRSIFIVHGHDTEGRDQLELALRRLGLQPFILMNTSGGGKTIIEALEGQIGKDHSSDFGIVLMTPDDIGYAKSQGTERAEPRARQNVILETGMLLSSLTRERIALIIKGHLEVPSDLQGIIHFGYNDHIREIVPKLCQRLKEAGFNIDANAISAAAS